MKRADFDRDKFISQTWPEALESGEFKQGQGTLYKGPKSGKNKMKGEFCCLGVACELLSRMKLLSRKDWVHHSGLTADARELLNMNGVGEYGNVGRALAYDNDAGRNFSAIAQTIRRVAKSRRAGFRKINQD